MFTLEQKVDLILRYIATNDNAQRGKLKKLVIEALNSSEAVPSTIITIDDLICDLLKNLGMPQHLSGYKHVTEAIKLCIQNPEYLGSITYHLYPDIARLHNASWKSVERTMRYAINYMLDNGDLENIERTFGNAISLANGNVSNAEFITACTNEIVRRMKKYGITK